MGHVREYTTREVMSFIRKIGFVPQSRLFRGDYPAAWKRFAIRMRPGLSPFVSIVAVKPGAPAGP